MVNLWFVRGLESFEAAVAASPTFAQAHVCRGGALTTLGRHAEAAKSYELARSHRSGPYYDATRQLGLALLEGEDGGRAERSQLKRAAALLSEAAAMRPTDHDAQLDYASALRTVGSRHAHASRFADAAASFRRALNVTPTDGSTYRQLANALQDQGGARASKRVVAALEAAVRLEPTDAEAAAELRAARLRHAVKKAGGWSRQLEQTVQAEVGARG